MKIAILIILIILMALPTPDSLDVIARNYQAGMTMTDFGKFAASYRSDQPARYTEWHMDGEWWVKPLNIRRIEQVTTEYLDGVCLGREVVTTVRQEYGKAERSYSPKHYYVEENYVEPKPVPTLQEVIDSIDKDNPDMAFWITILDGLK